MFSSPDWQGGPFVLVSPVTGGFQVGKEGSLQREGNSTTNYHTNETQFTNGGCWKKDGVCR